MSMFVIQVRVLLFALFVGVFTNAFAYEKEQFQFITATGYPTTNYKESYKPANLYEIVPGTYKLQFGAAASASRLMKFFVPPGANRLNGRFLMSLSAQPVQGVWRKGLPPSIDSTGVTSQAASALSNNGGDWGDAVIINTMNGVNQYFYGEPNAGATIISYGSSMPANASLQTGEYIYSDFSYQFGSSINFDVFWFVNKSCYDTWWARADVWDSLGNPKENMVHTCTQPQETLTVSPTSLTAGSLFLNTAVLTMSPATTALPTSCSATLTGSAGTSAADIVTINGATIQLASTALARVTTATSVTITCGNYSTNIVVNPQAATLTGIQVGNTSSPTLAADAPNSTLTINPIPSNAVMSGSCTSSNAALIPDPGTTYVVQLNAAAAAALVIDTVVDITCGALPPVKVTVTKKTPVTYTGFVLTPSILKVGGVAVGSVISPNAGENIPSGVCSIANNNFVRLNAATNTISFVSDQTSLSNLTKPTSVVVSCGTFSRDLSIQPLRYATMTVDTSATSPASWSISALTIGYSPTETTKANEASTTYKPAVYARLNLTAYDQQLHEEKYELIPYTQANGALGWIAYKWTSVGWMKIPGLSNDKVEPLLAQAKPAVSSYEYSISGSIPLVGLNSTLIDSLRVAKITADVAYFGTSGQVELIQNVWSWNTP